MEILEVGLHDHKMSKHLKNSSGKSMQDLLLMVLFGGDLMFWRYQKGHKMSPEGKFKQDLTLMVLSGGDLTCFGDIRGQYNGPSNEQTPAEA